MLAGMFEAVRAETLPADYTLGSVANAVGISPQFGRWTDTVELVYDPDEAPADFADADSFLVLLERAVAQWERVSGIRFYIHESNNQVPDDHGLPDSDGLVRISWEDLSEAGINGKAGVVFDGFDPDLGYHPFMDGAVQLHSDASVWDSDEELVQVLAHELGHLLGLGHSDNPASVMFASPYNHLRYPREDDIRLVQVLYGRPDVPVPVDFVLPDWQFQPPQHNPDPAPYLFVKNQHSRSDNGAFFSDSNQDRIAKVDDRTTAGWIYLAASIGNYQNTVDIDIETQMVLVDPDGYEHGRWQVRLTCNKNLACVRFFGIARSETLRTVPGDWHLYVLDANGSSVIFDSGLRVDSKDDYNLPPLAALQVLATENPLRPRFVVNTDDPEKDSISIIWHPPVRQDETESALVDMPGKNGLASREIDFPTGGTQSFFVELRDDADTGNDAAATYRNLMRITVELPFTEVSSWHVEASVPANRKQQRLLKAIATIPADPQAVRSTAGGHSPVAFLFGASTDEGQSISSSFRAGEQVVVAGSLRPRPQDIGAAAEVFLVVSLATGNGPDLWFYRNSKGQFLPWTDGNLDSLEPAFPVAGLGGAENFELYAGPLARAELGIYLGYRLQGNAELHYTAVPFQLHVSD